MQLLQPVVPPGAPRPGTILFVRDRTVWRNILATELRFSGYRVLEAGTGAAALRLVMQSITPTVDVLVLEAGSSLPPPEVMAYLRRLNPELAVLLLGDTIPEDVDVSHTACLPRPFSKTTFMETVHRLLYR